MIRREGDLVLISILRTSERKRRDLNKLRSRFLALNKIQKENTNTSAQGGLHGSSMRKHNTN